MSILPIPPKIPLPTPDPSLIVKIIHGIINAGKLAWSVITGKDKVQDEISIKKGFDPEKSKANEIAELNKLLNEYRKNIISTGEQLEKQMIIECVMQLQEIMGLFEECNSTLKIARTATVKRKFKRLTDSLKGTFAEYIEKRISLDDAECVRTLKLPAGELKNQRLQEMKQKVFIEASNAIVDKIKDSIEDFLETVQDSFEEHLERAEENIQAKADAFDKIYQSTQDDSQSMEEVVLNANYVLCMCACADTLIFEEV